MNINKYLTETDILLINNLYIKEFETNININNFIYNISIKNNNILLLNYNINTNNFLFIFDLISKDIKLYIILNYTLIKFINYKENINVYYEYDGIYIYYTNKIIIYNKFLKRISINKNNIQYIKEYNNNKLYKYSLHKNIYEFYYKIFKIYKIFKLNIFLYYKNINKNILI